MKVKTKKYIFEAISFSKNLILNKWEPRFFFDGVTSYNFNRNDSIKSSYKFKEGKN